MVKQEHQKKPALPGRTILSLLLEIAAYAAPRGNRQIRARIIGAFACLVLAGLALYKTESETSRS